MTPALEQIKALPAKWRREAVEECNLTLSERRAMKRCAADLDTALQALRDEAGEAVLPCDVIVAPATRIRAGCKLSTLLHCIDTRRNAPPLPDPDPEAFAALLRDLRRPAPAAEAAPQSGDGLLPDALVPVAREWYALCERAAYVDRIRISGKLAEAIVAAVVKGAATPPSAPAVEAIPQAAVWLEQNGQDATMEWQAGWDACRVEYPSRRLSAPVPQEGVDWQKRCLEHGFKYWRAPDAHGVECTHEQALDLLRDLLGVEVDFVEPAALAAGALPQDMVLVPREPTQEQVRAGTLTGILTPNQASAAYQAMLAAAPAQGVL